MCIICVDFQKQRLTAPEVRNILRSGEMKIDPDHLEEIEEMIQNETLD